VWPSAAAARQPPSPPRTFVIAYIEGPHSDSPTDVSFRCGWNPVNRQRHRSDDDRYRFGGNRPDTEPGARVLKHGDTFAVFDR
jgi:hypothetical protein